ncbi:hypothetical protein ACL07V_31455 [Streptomyces sp. MB22_4]|uniref:hypothetical protein n=1 Tax=Streptomyces sp. MB22_4 TaxID=3383120 RepID=UPI0039A039AE
MAKQWTFNGPTMPAEPGDMPLPDWAHRYVNCLTGIGERTRRDHKQDIDNHLSIIQHREPSGRITTATIRNVTSDDVEDRVRAEEAGERAPRQAGGVAAAEVEPEEHRQPSRTAVGDRAGRGNGRAAAAVEELLSRHAPAPRRGWHRRRDVLPGARGVRPDRRRDGGPHALDLADWLVGTGMRWGEATALHVRDVDHPLHSVQRAWKRAASGDSGPAYFLGPPKTKKARLIIALSLFRRT